ncbi:Na+/H+ antiporter NhaC family protein [Halorubrum lacusprofundi]|jgi:Na+/H+ antiporter NhaC|uniref:Na+/H+ antiporter NhaC n=1 Tax=Halorubrum lacusprofundi (strain ATCC 49239 / DSM 5036 / JCM 8891 / ACAM 34) TaxID=416348 RepID=B9LNM8_HALLT|nr:Na+/H+ antiporter NhaC family protein [Halorubrum lacusprofundi]ACM56966.1 Na+/H+ antiporter NhaC [Halorubrum lacusprofundi ATCC 49239]MCG1006601.1 Na+/H+ antiporter NhaC family protein [Halorubrum lacusprofundi]
MTGAETFGAISLVPPLLAIVLAIVTRKPILSLFLGIWSGGVIFTTSHGVAQTLDWLVSSIGESTFNAKIMLIVLFLGAGVALIWRLGGANAIANTVTSSLDTQRKVGGATWLFGMLWFFDDYSNTAIVGTTMREISDEVQISREKLAYMIDSTAAPVATFGISSWVAYQLSMIREGYSAAGVSVEAGEVPGAFALFLQSIPFNMYCLFAVVMVGIIVFSGRDFGEMLDAEHRSATEGKLLRDGAIPMQSAEDSLGEVLTDSPQLRYFAVPTLSLMAVVVGGAAYTGLGGSEPGASVFEIAGNAAFVDALLWGTFTMVAVALVMGVGSGIANLDEAMETVIDGFSMMLTALTILVMAWTIGSVTTALGTGIYVTNIAENFVTPTLLPVVVLVASAFIAFSTGTSWGTMAIVTPIAVPLAWSVGGATPALLPVAIGTVFSGAIFGDHCSPISDTTILSSTFTGADHIDHVRTQMYYATTVLVVAASLLTVWGATRITPLVLLPVGVVMLGGLVYVLSEFDANRKDVEATRTVRVGNRSATDDD